MENTRKINRSSEDTQAMGAGLERLRWRRYTVDKAWCQILAGGRFNFYASYTQICFTKKAKPGLRNERDGMGGEGSLWGKAEEIIGGICSNPCCVCFYFSQHSNHYKGLH